MCAHQAAAHKALPFVGLIKLLLIEFELEVTVCVRLCSTVYTSHTVKTGQHGHFLDAAAQPAF